jgi:hypothetical protein
MSARRAARTMRIVHQTPDHGRRTADDVGSLIVHRPLSTVHCQTSHHERLLATKGGECVERRASSAWRRARPIR